MMSYTYFLVLIKGNTNNKLNDYRKLCRFCLENKIHGIDISDDNNCKTKQQRDAILNNYSIITKQCLPISDEYPNFVCLSCEGNLTQYANFARQIQLNAENWETFLQNDTEVKDRNELNPMTVAEIEEIKIECCDENYDEVPNVYDALETTPLKIEQNDDNVSDTSVTALVRPKKPTIDWSEESRMLFINQSTEFERTCKLCDEPTFPSLARFYKHQRQHHPDEKSFHCAICSSRFNNKNRLATHMKERHAKCGKKHQCQYCAKLFYSDREVKGHEKFHLNARSYVCNLCGKGFNQKTILNVHLKSKAHNANYKTIKQKRNKKQPSYNYKLKQVFRCQLCVPSSVFSSPEERTAHRNALHRKFECDICKNSFMAQESLDCHKLLHSDKPRPFVCSVCNATFTISSHLSSHFKRKHTNDKSFECSFCDKNFFESCELNAHVRLVHKKKDRVKCNKCDSDFATDKYLHKHILQKHTTEASPYDCKICGKRTENGVKLDQHRLKHHKIVN